MEETLLESLLDGVIPLGVEDFLEGFPGVGLAGQDHLDVVHGETCDKIDSDLIGLHRDGVGPGVDIPEHDLGHGITGVSPLLADGVKERLVSGHNDIMVMTIPCTLVLTGSVELHIGDDENPLRKFLLGDLVANGRLQQKVEHHLQVGVGAVIVAAHLIVLVSKSLTSGEIDLYPEYTGTGLITILGMEALTDQDEVYNTVKDAYNKQFNITWLDYAQANDGQGLFISRKASDEYGITNISQLQANADRLRFCSQGEFDEREDGIPGLTRLYGEFNWKSSKIYDNGLKWEVVDNDEADVATAYTTEAHLTETDKYVLLEDDKHMWPPYNLAPIVRNEVLEQYPEIADVLNKVSAALDTETVTGLNAQVDIEGEEYEDVAADFYKSIK